MAIITGGRYPPGTGLGTPLLFPGTPVNGVSGTFAGIAPPGAELVDTVTGARYLNTNTQASPTWAAHT